MNNNTSFNRSDENNRNISSKAHFYQQENVYSDKKQADKVPPDYLNKVGHGSYQQQRMEPEMQKDPISFQSIKNNQVPCFYNTIQHGNVAPNGGYQMNNQLNINKTENKPYEQASAQYYYTQQCQTNTGYNAFADHRSPVQHYSYQQSPVGTGYDGTFQPYNNQQQIVNTTCNQVPLQSYGSQQQNETTSNSQNCQQQKEEMKFNQVNQQFTNNQVHDQSDVNRNLQDQNTQKKTPKGQDKKRNVKSRNKIKYSGLKTEFQKKTLNFVVGLIMAALLIVLLVIIYKVIDKTKKGENTSSNRPPIDNPDTEEASSDYTSSDDTLTDETTYEDEDS